MKVVAAFFIALLAIFLLVFVISGLSSTFEDIATFRTNLAERRAERASRAVASAGIVRGVSEETLPNFVYPGARVDTVLRDYPHATRFQSYFNETDGTTYVSQPIFYTLFIPVDSAFDALSNPLKSEFSVLSMEQKQRLVQYHIVPEKMIQVGMPIYGWIQTLSGDTLNFELRKNGGTVGNARILAVYIVDNGIVYLIDRVLLPPGKSAVR